jgi:hypothetical protein
MTITKSARRLPSPAPAPTAGWHSAPSAFHTHAQRIPTAARSYDMFSGKMRQLAAPHWTSCASSHTKRSRNNYRGQDGEWSETKAVQRARHFLQPSVTAPSERGSRPGNSTAVTWFVLPFYRLFNGFGDKDTTADGAVLSGTGKRHVHRLLAAWNTTQCVHTATMRHLLTQ